MLFAPMLSLCGPCRLQKMWLLGLRALPQSLRVRKGMPTSLQSLTPSWRGWRAQSRQTAR